MKKSYIDEYNDLVDKKCNETLLAKKNKIKQNVMSSNLVFDKNLNAFITPKLITEKQFMSSVKNLFQYLDQSIPSEPVLEDLYDKVFNLYSLEQFMEFTDLVEFGGFNNLTEAYNAFLKNNESQDVTEIKEQTFSQIYPPVGSEGDFGFAPSGMNKEMSITSREQAETERRGSNFREGQGLIRPVLNILGGDRGRPKETILDPAPQTTGEPISTPNIF